jgi:phosphate-selective porin OprO/OprP
MSSNLFPSALRVPLRSLLVVVLLGVLWISLAAPLAAEDEAAAPQEGEANVNLFDLGIGIPRLKAGSVFDRIWEIPKLYRNDDAALIQEISLFGRYQGQYWGVDSRQGAADGWENRRMRLGARTRFLKLFTLAANFNLETDEGVDFSTLDQESIDTLTLAWTLREDTQVVVGQQKPGFMYEYDTSSNSMLTFERSLLVNQLAPDKSPGIMLEQKWNRFLYRVGGYSGMALGDGLDNPFGLLAIRYDLSDHSRFEKMGLQFYYLYNSELDSEGPSPYQHSYSVSADFEDGPWSFLGQAIYADSFGELPSAWGFTLMPARYVYEEKLQLVARYQFANSTGIDGLSAQSRYEQKVPLTDDGLGDRYHAGYLGLNWYVNGNRFKVMTGVEYSHLAGGGDGGDYAGWTWFSGLRLFF